jgi:hypothetical protein
MFITSRIFPLVSAVCILAAFSSCRGNVDYDDPSYVPEGVLRIFADKSTIDADGQDVVTFTVKFGSRDVSTDSDMNLIRVVNGEEITLKPGLNTFSTTAAAEYRFKARYYSSGAVYTDNEAVVNAVGVDEGVGQKDYYQKLWAMQFTAVSCEYCPMLAASLKNVKASYPDRIVQTAFHVAFSEDTMPDPMRLDINDSFRALVQHGTGLPLFAFNMMKSERNIVSEEDLIRNQLQKMLKDYPAECGVRIQSEYDPASRTVTITSGVTSNVRKVYWLHVILVEDGVQYAQAGVNGLYVHDNVVRSVLSGNVYGDKINSGVALREGVEVTVTSGMSVPEGCNPENMRVIVAALSSPDDGKTIICNNINECALVASVNYSYN